MTEELYHKYDSSLWYRYFIQRAKARARINRSCSTCAHDGCCDHYCGGSYWQSEEEGGEEQ